jgi:hypothetical protein
MTTTQQPRITLEVLSGAISNVSSRSITLNVLITLAIAKKWRRPAFWQPQWD